MAATEQSTTNSLFVFLCAVLVFFMHTGFAMLEGGGVQAKNRQSILIKNVTLIATSALSWWILGFMLSSSSLAGDENKVLGTDGDMVVLSGVYKTGGNLIDTWFFGFAFAATAATIVSGAVAERTHLRAYIVYSGIITAFVYPVVAYWGWNGDGWLKNAGSKRDTTMGYMDFAGSGIVHMVGGGAGLVAAIIVGPRKFMDNPDIDNKIGSAQSIKYQGQEYIPRFDEDGMNQPAMATSSLPFSALGTLILWVGWYGFNCGSEFAITGSSVNVVGLVAVNTTLGASASAFCYFALSYFFQEPDLTGILNSALGGLVSVTANCNCIEPWAAVTIGAIAAPVYVGSSYLLRRMQIDDVIDASPVHFFCGMWGVLATGLFASDALTGGHKAGVFYGDGELLLWNFVGVVAITAWTGGITAIFCFPLSFMNCLRISEEEEKLGLDGMMLKHGLASINTPSKRAPTDLKNGSAEEINLDVVEDPVKPEPLPEPEPAAPREGCCGGP